MRGGTYRQFHPTVLVSFVSLEPTAPSGGYASQRADESPGFNRSPAVLNQTKQSFGLDLGLRECELWIKEQTPEYDEGHWPGMEASKGQIPAMQWRSLESQWQ